MQPQKCQHISDYTVHQKKQYKNNSKCKIHISQLVTSSSQPRYILCLSIIKEGEEEDSNLGVFKLYKYNYTGTSGCSDYTFTHEFDVSHISCT